MVDIRNYKNLNFSTFDDKVKNGYQAFLRYYEAYQKGATEVEATDGSKISFAEMEKRQKKFVRDEVNRLTKYDILSETPTMQECIKATPVLFEVIGMMTELILPTAMNKSGLEKICEFRYIGWGDTARFDIRARDLFVVSKVSKGVRHAFNERTYDGEVTLAAEARELTVEASLYNILCGTASLAEFVSKVIMAFENNLIKDIYTCLLGGTNGLAQSGSKQLQLNGYIQDEYVALAQKIGAWNGSEPLAIGTKLALNKVTPSGTNYTMYSELGSEFTRLGYLTDMMGINTLELKQVADYTVEFGTLIDDDKIFLISPVGKPIKVVFEGTPIAIPAENFNYADLKVRTSLIKMYGVGFISNALIGRVNLT